MKKFFTLALALSIGASLHADKITILSCGAGTPGIDEPQLMGLGISPNGQFVCGPIENGAGYFVADVNTGLLRWSLASVDEGGELRHVDNNGLAIGFTDKGITYDLYTHTETLLEAPEGFRYILGEALTNDGSLLVGSLIGSGFGTEAAYSTDGDHWTLLPIPSEEELGDLNPRSTNSAPKQVSGDGKYIFGYIGNFGIPMLWIRNDKGEYDYDFFPSRFIVDTEKTEKLVSLSAMFLNMSNNGRYLSMLAQYQDGEGSFRNIPAIYDTQEKKMNLYTEIQAIDEDNRGLYPSCISDDGTFIGTIGTPYFNSAGTFIMKAGETQAKTFKEEFPDYFDHVGPADELGFNMPTGMSADGRYILGYTYYCDDYMNDLADAYYVTYVIDTTAPYSVEGIEEEKKTAEPAAYYDIDGRLLNGPARGINIIKMTDGSIRKSVIK